MVTLKLRTRFRLKFEIKLAARLLPLMIRNRDLAATLKYIEVDADKDFCGVEPTRIAKQVMRATKRPWFMRDRQCLRQGLLGMRFLRKAGYNPVLKFGIDRSSVNSRKLSAHCWVELNGRALINDILENMVVVYSVPEETKP